MNLTTMTCADCESTNIGFVLFGEGKSTIFILKDRKIIVDDEDCNIKTIEDLIKVRNEYPCMIVYCEECGEHGDEGTANFEFEDGTITTDEDEAIEKFLDS